MPFSDARRIVLDAIDRRAFPAAVVEAGSARETLWQEAFGTLTYEAGAPRTTAETIFDLASLTKVVATSALLMSLIEQSRLGLDDPVARWISEWRGADREGVTIEQALLHSTGLPAWLPLFHDHEGRAQYTAAIGRTPLEYAPGTASIYSDLGFILLGFIVEDAGGAPLDRQIEDMARRLNLGEVRYHPPEAWRVRTAPTEYDRWRGRLLVGEVHDENAAALGGSAGHAGLFGTASALGRFARMTMRARAGEPDACARLASRPAVVRFTSRGQVPGSSRALGWDTMLPTSSCGARMSPQAFGHTGFTGTSLWIDPVNDVYVVFLTNRVHPSREDDAAIKAVRPALHDAILEQIRRR